MLRTISAVVAKGASPCCMYVRGWLFSHSVTRSMPCFQGRVAAVSFNWSNKVVKYFLYIQPRYGNGLALQHPREATAAVMRVQSWAVSSSCSSSSPPSLAPSSSRTASSPGWTKVCHHEPQVRLDQPSFAILI